MGIKLSGIKELKAALEDHSKVKEVAGPIVKYHGAQLQGNAQRRAPVDTGNLKRSIRLDIKDGGMTAEVAATADYSGYVEYVTRFMTAQPYVRPAFLQQEGKFVKDLERVLGE